MILDTSGQCIESCLFDHFELKLHDHNILSGTIPGSQYKIWVPV